jgi:hypothetical protein
MWLSELYILCEVLGYGLLVDREKLWIDIEIFKATTTLRNWEKSKVSPKQVKSRNQQYGPQQTLQ